MTKAAYSIAGLVALLHIGFFVLEALLWDHPIGRSIFNMTETQSASSAVLAANQGFYNLMVAVGLFLALLRKNISLMQFLLVFVFAVGMFGAVTVSSTIFFVQALPALIAFFLINRVRAAQDTPTHAG